MVNESAAVRIFILGLSIVIAPLLPCSVPAEADSHPGSKTKPNAGKDAPKDTPKPDAKAKDTNAKDGSKSKDDKSKDAGSKDGSKSKDAGSRSSGDEVPPRGYR